MYSITVYVPSSHIEVVKQAMFEAGAGRLGHYEHCAWQTLGQGQFKPLLNSQPFLGEKGKVEIVEEYELSMVCEKTHIHKVIKALKLAHPYEQAAYRVSSLEIIE
jgi:hypothetical protein